MSTDTAGLTGTMHAWLKGALLGAVAFAICWGGAISFWRTTDRMPATWELVLYLFGLPIVLLLAFWMGQRAVAARQSQPSVATPVPPASAGAAAAHVTDLAILAASIRLPHGSSPGELAAAIEANKARPDLDDELVDEDGFPVMTARCSDAMDEELQAEITDWFEENGISNLNFSDEHWRALTLASAVAKELAGYASSELLTPAEAEPRLQLIPLLPPHWPTEHRIAACMWLKYTVKQCGWLDKQIALEEDVLATPETATPSAVFARLTRNAPMAKCPTLGMVIACESNIGDETVANWIENRSLFTASRSDGAIPGEGAAGLLVSATSMAQMFKSNMCVVVGIDEARLDASAEKTKRIDPKVVRELMERVLKAGAVDFADIGKTIADTDHRSNRTLELIGSTATRMPQLDEADDVVRVGVATGSCGQVSVMTALVLAWHHALALQSPVLAISNQDAYHRVAALVRPAGLES